MQLSGFNFASETIREIINFHISAILIILLPHPRVSNDKFPHLSSRSTLRSIALAQTKFCEPKAEIFSPFSDNQIAMLDGHGFLAASA
jgi:hypothetical protein